MDRFGRWQRLYRAIFALAVALLVLGPTIDSFLCQAEIPAIGPFHTQSVEAASVDQDGGHHKGGSLLDQDGICAHGHCHHGVQYITAVYSRVTEPSQQVARLYLNTNLPPSDDHRLGLKRPPRA